MTTVRKNTSIIWQKRACSGRVWTASFSGSESGFGRASGGAFLCARFGGDASEWRGLLQNASLQPGGRASVRPFFLPYKDAIEKGDDRIEDGFVLHLTKLRELDPEPVETELIRRRVQRATLALDRQRRKNGWCDPGTLTGWSSRKGGDPALLRLSSASDEARENLY